MGYIEGTYLGKSDSLLMYDGDKRPLLRWNGQNNRTIIGIHGLGDRGSCWESCATYWNELGFNVLAPDNRCFGLSNNFGKEIPNQKIISDIVQLVDIENQLTRNKVILVGESLGGAFVVQAAEICGSSKIEKIILMAPAFWEEGLIISRKARLSIMHFIEDTKWLRKIISISPSDDIRALSDYGKDACRLRRPNKKMILDFLLTIDFACAANLPQEIQTLVQIGLRDQIIPISGMKRWVNNNTHVKTILYDEGWHWLSRCNISKEVMNDQNNFLLNNCNKLETKFDYSKENKNWIPGGSQDIWGSKFRRLIGLLG